MFEAACYLCGLLFASLCLYASLKWFSMWNKPVRRPTSCSCVFSGERSGLLTVKLGAGEAGFRKSSSAESELDMASPGFSVSPAGENTTITLGRGSVRLSWMNLLTRVVAAGSGLKDRAWRSLLQPSEPLEPLEPFCCMRAAGQLSPQIWGW